LTHEAGRLAVEQGRYDADILGNEAGVQCEAFELRERAQLAEPFAASWVPAIGIHGSVATARTMAIVGGGHPAVPEIAASIRERLPRLRDWAPTLACLMNVALPHAEGLDLLDAARLEPAKG
jgi:hypothetical protein